MVSIRIPPQLLPLPWTAWAYGEPRKGSRKRPKIPINPQTGRAALVNSPRTWGTFDAAVAAVQRFGLDGVGVILRRRYGITGIDLDHCRDGDTLDDWADEILSAMPDTYAESSPSGTGVRAFVNGLPPKGIRCRNGDVEVYCNDRFLTVTGNRLPDRPLEISDQPDGLKWLIDSRLAPKPVVEPPAVVTPFTGDDTAVLSAARAAKNGAGFSRLFDRGDTSHYPSPSEADFALCLRLGFWVGADAGRIDRLFRRSALLRPKWDTPNGSGTYGSRTVAEAVRNLRVTRSTPPTLSLSGTLPLPDPHPAEETTLCFKSDYKTPVLLTDRRRIPERVFDHVAGFINEKGRSVYISNREVARELGVSQQAVSKAFRELTSAGRLVLVQQGQYHGAKGKRKASVYDLPRTEGS